jgi:hypothetical protein
MKKTTKAKYLFYAAANERAIPSERNTQEKKCTGFYRNANKTIS